MIISLNKKNVKNSVEKQRRILYWSLAAFYVTVPVTMILGAQYNDQLISYNLNKFPRTPEQVQKINNIGLAHNIFQGITIALGVNYFIQLIVYLVKADRVLPRKIYPNVKKWAKAKETFTVNTETEKIIKRKLFKDNKKISSGEIDL